MRPARHLFWAAAAGLLASAGALAQPQAGADARQQTQAEPTPALACVRVKAGEPELPEYPFVEYKDGTTGRVRATVTLPGGLLGNRVHIESSAGGEAFEQEVRRWLRSLEAPCLAAGETATLSYDLIFKPDSREVLWAPPVDANESENSKLAQCVRHVSGAPAPDFPARAQRAEVQGRVLAVMGFKGPDSAPEVQLFMRRSAEVFRPTVVDWVAGLRMPCHTGTDVSKVSVVYVFRFEGQAYGFKSLDLLTLLRVGKGVLDPPLALDTTTMGCPFQMRFGYFQPMRVNSVGEVGESNPRRRPLVDLLRTLELNLPRASLDSVFADTADVSVPCFRLTLNPQEKKP